MPKQKMSYEAQQALAVRVREEIGLYKEGKLQRFTTLIELAKPLEVCFSTINNYLHKFLTPREIRYRNFGIKSNVRTGAKKSYRRLQSKDGKDKLVIDRDKWDNDHSDLVEKLVSDEDFCSGEIRAEQGKIYFSIIIDKGDPHGEVSLTATSGKNMGQLGNVINNYGLRIVHTRLKDGYPSLLVCQLNPNDPKYEYAGKVEGKK